MASTFPAARPIVVHAGGKALDGSLARPANARAIIVFAHGSGSSRFSPRNRFVAGVLNDRGMATLLFDLLTADEESMDERSGRLRFDIALLAARLVGAMDWLQTLDEAASLRVGLFGASTGGGAALVAAADRPREIGAVVSRGGRPDLAGSALPRVHAPTLLVVGGDDEPVIALNRRAMARMRAETRMEIIPGATHLFEEPGALQSVALLAADWFDRQLVQRPPLA